MMHADFSLMSLTASRRFLGLDWSALSAFGLLGNAIFTTRFLVQWIASERRGESVIPIAFWYLSIVGSLILCTYFAIQRDPVGTLAYVPNSFVYARNLYLIRKHRLATGTAARA
jgi:lipid-A-disaccharide synthase-like uncharacterized protein